VAPSIVCRLCARFAADGPLARPLDVLSVSPEIGIGLELLRKCVHDVSLFSEGPPTHGLSFTDVAATQQYSTEGGREVSSTFFCIYRTQQKNTLGASWVQCNGLLI